ncbi:MAG: winged helix-turn-helix transcriptional regulator [Phototrophicaceae bacterium]
MQGSTLSAHCPSRHALELIADKWVTLVIVMLAQNEMCRYNEMLRSIEGISKKMLTQTLRALESNGLITRKVYAIVPPMVEYRLTPLGQSLIPLLVAIKDWAELYWQDVETARHDYEARLGLQDISRP